MRFTGAISRHQHCIDSIKARPSTITGCRRQARTLKNIKRLSSLSRPSLHSIETFLMALLPTSHQLVVGTNKGYPFWRIELVGKSLARSGERPQNRAITKARDWSYQPPSAVVKICRLSSNNSCNWRPNTNRNIGGTITTWPSPRPPISKPQYNKAILIAVFCHQSTINTPHMAATLVFYPTQGNPNISNNRHRPHDTPQINTSNSLMALHAKFLKTTTLRRTTNAVAA